MARNIPSSRGLHRRSGGSVEQRSRHGGCSTALMTDSRSSLSALCEPPSQKEEDPWPELLSRRCRPPGIAAGVVPAIVWRACRNNFSRKHAGSAPEPGSAAVLIRRSASSARTGSTPIVVPTHLADNVIDSVGPAVVQAVTAGPLEQESSEARTRVVRRMVTSTTSPDECANRWDRASTVGCSGRW